MPSAMRNIVKSVLEYIKENGLQPTPETYRQIFCEKAKEYGFKVSECDRLSSLAQKLSEEEKNELSQMNIVDVDTLFDFVVSKLRQKEQDMLGNGGVILSDITLEKIASLMLASLIPAYSHKQYDESVKELQDEIHKNPTLLGDDKFHENIKYLIEKRIDLDQQTLTDKTSKMSMLINKMSSFIDHTVKHSGNSSKNLISISDELKSISFSDFDENTFGNFKDKMIQISDKIQSEVTMLSENLHKEKNEVTILKEKIKALESNLKVAQVESSTDFLTGVYTRRAFEKEITSYESDFINSKKDYIVIFVDLDYFKTVNDKYGHDAGDVVLSTFAKLLQKKAPQNSLVARYGGEEFVIALQSSTIINAKNYLQVVSEFVHKSKFVYNDLTIKVTFSAGISARSTQPSLDETIKDADKYLYKAKHLGRDRIESNYF